MLISLLKAQLRGHWDQKFISTAILYGWWLQADTCWSCSANGVVPMYIIAEHTETLLALKVSVVCAAVLFELMWAEVCITALKKVGRKMSEGAPFHVEDESHIVLAEFQHLSLCVQADDGGFLVVAPEPVALLQPIKLSWFALILLWAKLGTERLQ